MKTVRFSQLVEAAGHPEVHLALVKPAQDKELQRAIKAHRVVTVFQTMVGNETDHGEEGFHPGEARQYLIFRRSVKRFAGRRIVGIKYDLLDNSSPSKSEAYHPQPRPRAERPRRNVKKVEKSKSGNEVKKPFPVKVKARRAASAEPPKVKALKAAVRKAMKALEKGKQVAAFELLCGIVEN